MKYEIIGNPYPAVVCELERGEAVKTEKGSMVWMDPVFTMETKGGGVKKALGRALAGESMFQNIFTAKAPGKIAFGSSFPGRILPLQIDAQHTYVVQKMAFLASTMGVELSMTFRKKLGAGAFGGEGFIMESLTGNGIVFLECDGELVDYELAAGQTLLVDTGNVLGYTQGVTLEIEKISGVKNVLFGGEGLFNTKLTGPGHVWLQTMPLANVIDVIAAHMPVSN